MMGRRLFTPILLVSLIAIATAIGAGTAYAYWSAGGAGTGPGSTGTTVAITLSPGTPSAGLYPGGQSNVVVTASNPNTSPVHIGSLTLDPSQGTGGFTVDAGHAACAVSTFMFAIQTNSGAGWTMPAKVGSTNGSLVITLSNALTMSSTAANACQGSTATVYLVAGP